MKMGSRNETRLFRALKAPLSVQIEVTENCNHRCTHCYNCWKKGGISNFNNMSLDVAKKIADEIISSEVFSVTLTGGEPLLNYDVTKFLVNIFNEAKIPVSINSNLTLITSDMIDEFKKANVTGIMVSILGASSRVHDKITGIDGSFDRLLAGMALCAKKDFSIGANMVVTKENFFDFTRVAKLVRDYGCFDFTFSIGIPPEHDINNKTRYLSVEEMKDLFNMSLDISKKVFYKPKCLIEAPLCFLKELKNPLEYCTNSCGIGVTGCTIGCTGDVRDCPLSAEIYGNLTCESLPIIWKRFDKWRTTELVPEECKSCELLGDCFGGCRRQAYIASHMTSMNAKNPLMIKENVNDTLKLLISKKSIKENVSLGTKIIFIFEKIRNEDFGGIIFKNGKRILLDENAYSLLTKITINKEYDISSFGYGYHDFFKTLISMGFAKTNA